jgi:LmbE family N-acetylglucosaminyl deacetylase
MQRAGRVVAGVIVGALGMVSVAMAPVARAQQPTHGTAPAPVLTVPPLGSAALAELKAGLGVHTRVLVIGAHPDDEDTPLIAWLARGHRAETAYLSLTRGDGGQNLIGNELGEALGVIRTEELLAARRIDGAHQYFARAFDFGFSKNTEDSFKHWPHDSLLGDVVKVIRAFRPQIIVSVFSGTPRDGHGQHQVAGILAREAYDLAADTVRFPVSVYGPAWTPLKFYRGARFSPDRATISMNVGEYNANLGESYAEIAAQSRSQHKSQGFGSRRVLGVVMDYLTREATRVNEQTAPTQEHSIFDGIDTTRVVTQDDRDALALAESQVAVEAIAQRERVALGDSVPVRVSVYKAGVLDSASVRTIYAHGTSLTQPYWLARPRIGDLFAFASDSISDDEREKQDWLSVPVSVPGRNAPILVRVPAVYRYADPVRGDIQRPLVVAPAVSVTLSRDVELARAGVAFERAFEVTLRSSLAQPCSLSVHLILPAGMTAVTPPMTVVLDPGATRVVTFTARGTLPAGVYDVRAEATDGHTTYARGYLPIEYEHITPERMYRDAVVHIHSVDVRMANIGRIGYVQGVGDNVAPTLRELGVSVTMLDPAAFPVTDLSVFPVIVVGTRAYQANQTLIDNNAYLLNYVKRGGHLVVQYGQGEMQRPGVMPYPVTLARIAARVTEEDAPVRIINPKSRFLNTPNRITAADFDGWVQERSVYMPSTFDPRYETALEMNDTGEPPNRAAILTTPFGKGRYTYVTLALFRQLPAGVPGGVRLFANLLTPATP